MLEASSFVIINLGRGCTSITTFYLFFDLMKNKIYFGSHKMFSQRKKGLKSQLQSTADGYMR